MYRQPLHHSPTPFISFNPLISSQQKGAAQEGKPHSPVGRCDLPKVTTLRWGRATQGGVLDTSVTGPGSRPQLQKADSCSTSHERLTHKEEAV